MFTCEGVSKEASAVSDAADIWEHPWAVLLAMPAPRSDAAEHSRALEWIADAGAMVWMQAQAEAW